MFQNLFPDFYISSAYDIPYEELYSQGKRALIFDIDNTLVVHGAPHNSASMELVSKLKAIGFQICFLSNNKEKRVKSFNQPVQCFYIHKAGKPKKEGYYLAMQQMGSDEDSTVFIGDQIFTDIWGANRTGIMTYLTEPISKKEEFQIVLKRILERPIIALYKAKQKKKHKNIVLIGYMGSGKSTIGRETANTLHKVFYDTDAIIEKREQLSITDIFERKGEPYFRNCETEVLLQLCEKTQAMIIATGGGVPLSPTNVTLLHKLGKVIYLKASSDVIAFRLRNDNNRPLLHTQHPKKTIEDMLAVRDPVYEAAADCVIDTDSMSIHEIVAAIEHTVM